MSDEEARHHTVMIAAFEGWNDACQAATNVVRHLITRYDSKEIRTIRCDGFYDYQVSRPMMCHVTGRRRIVWPQTTFYDITIGQGRHVYAQMAPEPNYRWMEYCRESLHIAEECDVDKVITLGSMFADCPHTRPLPLDVSDASSQCDMDRDYSGPVGIPTVLNAMAADEGFDTTTAWVSIPQYLGSDECAQGTLQMLRELEYLLGMDLDEGDLPAKAATWKSQASVLTRCNDELAEYVHNLEQEYDVKAASQRSKDVAAPQAQQLIKEAEAFLKHFDA